MDVSSVSRKQRHRSMEFLIESSLHLCVVPIVKYTSLSLFADRFLPSLNKRTTATRSWLLQSPLRDSNLQLFALISIWISNKIHDTTILPVLSLKSLGDQLIREQHFTMRDFLEAEVIFLQVLNFEIGVSRIAFVFLEELLIQFRELSRIGGLASFEACMDIMDLLYETEEMSILYSSPTSLAAAVLVATYVITVPKQQWEFPLLPWAKFVTSFEEKDMEVLVRSILNHVLNQPAE